MELGSPSCASPPPGSAPIVAVYGASSDSALGRALVAALGAAARLCELPASQADPSPDSRHPRRDPSHPGRTTAVVVGIHGAADAAAADRLDAWARAAQVAALSVQPRANDTIIGPLALPGRAGCGRCARSRMAAAAASAGGPGEPAPGDAAGATGDLPPEVIAVLVREITAILGAPAPAIASPLVDHVLVCGPSGAASRHRVIAPAHCAVCGGAAAWPATPPALGMSADDDPAQLLAALAGWLDPHTGVISRIALELSGDSGREPPIIATASPPHVVTEGGALRRLPLGWGKGMTLSGALLSAVGEAIERYAPSLPDPARVIAARCDELDAYLDPRDLALYSDEQYDRDGFAFRRFDPGIRHPWVRGTWLDSGAPVWVPAVLAYLALDLLPEQQICQGTSNGLAAACDADDAALRAILELVERDAFMAAWMTGRGGRPIELDDSLDPALGRVIAGIAALGARVELAELPVAACGTVVLALALGDGERYPGATIGLGADLDPRAAVRQAILELAQTGPHLCRLMRTRALPIPEHPAEVRDMIQHAVYYFPAARAAALDRVRGVGPAVALRDLAAPGAPRSLATCAGALAAAGVRVALVDVTSPDVATGPFRVVRAISPQLQPISYGHGLDHPPVDRLRASGPAGSPPPIHPLW